MPVGFFILDPGRLREAVFLLGQRSGWGLKDLLDLEEDDLLMWLDTGKRVMEKAENS